jgi:hypothetical protein
MREDIHAYKHGLYYLETILPHPIGLIGGLTGTGLILTLLAVLCSIYSFLASTFMTFYVVSQRNWMNLLRQLW